MSGTTLPSRKSFVPAVVGFYMFVVAFFSGALAILAFVGATALNTVVAAGLVALAVALLVDAVGLFMRLRWAYLLTVVLAALFVVMSIASTFSGGLDVSRILLILVNVGIIVVFVRDGETRAEFGRA